MEKKSRNAQKIHEKNPEAFQQKKKVIFFDQQGLIKITPMILRGSWSIRPINDRSMDTQNYRCPCCDRAAARDNYWPTHQCTIDRGIVPLQGRDLRSTSVLLRVHQDHGCSFYNSPYFMILPSDAYRIGVILSGCGFLLHPIC